MIKLSTVSLNGKRYTRSNAAEINNEIYDVDDFVGIDGRRYYANRFKVRGVSKTIRNLVN